MKKGYADITVVLDRSGSMGVIANDTIGGFNKFLKDQQEAPGEATFTLAQFDHEYEVVCNASPIAEVKPLDSRTFVPRGSTALLDAIGRTVFDTGVRLSKLDENQRPEKVIFVILTDGEENHSREFSKDKINEMISHQRDAYKWEFIFLGANQNAITVANDIGIKSSHSMSYAATGQGVGMAVNSVSANIRRSRAGGSSAYSVQDRLKQTEAGVDPLLNKVD